MCANFITFLCLYFSFAKCNAYFSFTLEEYHGAQDVTTFQTKLTNSYLFTLGFQLPWENSQIAYNPLQWFFKETHLSIF